MDIIHVKIKAKDGKPMNPFLLSKHISHTIGALTEAKQTREGLLTKITKAQKDKLNGSLINGREIEVEEDSTKNSSKGTIFYPAFNFVEVEEIIKEIPGIVAVERILKKGEAHISEKGTKPHLKNTGIYVLQFNRATKPTDVKICFEKVSVRNYYPRPFKCTKCHELGHTMKWCTKTEKCGVCGEAPHGQCTNQAKCVNCDGQHPAWSKMCPILSKEMDIIKYAIDNDVPFKVARERVQINLRHKTFADSLKTNNEVQQLKDELTLIKQQNADLKKLLADFKSGISTRHTSKTPAQDHLEKVREQLQKSQDNTEATTQYTTIDNQRNTIYYDDLDNQQDIDMEVTEYTSSHERHSPSDRDSPNSPSSKRSKKPKHRK